MINSLKAGLRAIALPALLYAAIITSNASVAYGDGMTGDPPAERPSATTSASADADTFGVIDFVLLLVAVL